MGKHKKPAKGFVASSNVDVIDFSPMRDRIDGVKKNVNALPESKQKNLIMKGLEDLYLWAGGYFPTFVPGATVGSATRGEANA